MPGAVRKEYLVALLGSQRVKSTRLAKNVCRVLTRRQPRAELGSSAQLRVLELLKPVAASERSLSLPEITTAVGVSKPTVFRMCQRLDAAGTRSCNLVAVASVARVNTRDRRINEWVAPSKELHPE